MTYLRNLVATICYFMLAASAQAYEAGYPGYAQKPGLTLGGGSAGVPPPGIYMFDQFATYQASLYGPGAPIINGSRTTNHVAGASTGFLFVPGWTFLGATYDAVVVLAASMGDVGAPVNVNPAGIKNPYIVPAELSWKLGDSGVFVKTGIGVRIPIGSIQGPAGLSNVGYPWWTFQPELVVSYLKDGWNLTANMFFELNTKNTLTDYKTGDMFHAEFTAAKKIDKWTVGPVAYYAAQVTGDTSSAFYKYAINTNKYELWAAGLLVGYDFGPVALNVWALNEFSAQASGGTSGLPGLDSAKITKGYSAFAQLSYRLWAPEEAAALPKRPQFSK